MRATLMVLAGILAASAAVAAPPVGAGLPIAISPGETVTLSADDAGRYAVVKVGEAAYAAEGRTPPHDTVEHTYDIANAVFSAADGTLVYTFWSTAAEGSRLKLENGLDRSVIYSARITHQRDGKEEATTICSVAPHKVGYESWPYPVSKVEITGFYHVDPGQSVCGYPERGELGPPPD